MPAHRPILLVLAFAAGIATASRSAPARAAEAAPPPLAELVAASRKDGRPILLEFYATWCGPCVAVEKRILPAAEVKKALEAFRFVRYDSDRAPGDAAAHDLEVSALPTFLMLDSDGEEVDRFQGAPGSPAALVRWLDAQAPRASGLDRMLARLKERPDDAGLLFQTALRYLKIGNMAEGGRLLERAEAADKGNKAGIAARAGWLRGLGEQRRATFDARRAFLEGFVRRYPGADNLNAALEALAALPEPTAETRTVFKEAVGRAARDPERLNELAYLGLRAGFLDEALKAAEQLAALRPQEGNSWDTLAEVHHYRGDRAGALELSTRALGLAPEGEEKRVMVANRARFERGTIDVRGPDGKVRKVPEPAPQIQAITGPDWEERPGGDTAGAAPGAAGPAGLAAAGDVGLPEPVRAAFERVADTCHAQAGAAAEVWVRVVLGTGPRAVKISVIEPGVSAALRGCVEKALASEAFPPAAPDYPTLTAPVVLKRRSAAPPWLKMR